MNDTNYRHEHEPDVCAIRIATHTFDARTIETLKRTLSVLPTVKIIGEQGQTLLVEYNGRRYNRDYVIGIVDGVTHTLRVQGGKTR